MNRYFYLAIIAIFPQSVLSDLKISDVSIDSKYLQEIVHGLSVKIGPRNFDQAKGLDAAAVYIRNELQKQGYSVQRQRYLIDETDEVENIIVSLGPKDGKRIIVGAHYDSYGNHPGADDNASGVAGLLAIAKFLKKYESELKKRIDLVAYTLEEPPFFRTKNMGSYVHAKSLVDNNVELIGMICLEMLGYYRNEKNSQDYPLGLMKWFYPREGDFIGVVSNFKSGSLKSYMAEFMAKAKIKVETLSAPSWLVGVDFSDHLNYWNFGYNAIMITDTAFYRNPNYHQKTDTIETLDFNKMKETVRGISYGLYNLARQ